MTAKMAHATRMELPDTIRSRDRTAANKNKHRILGELIAATGITKKSAIGVLDGRPAQDRRQTRQRQSLYDEVARSA